MELKINTEYPTRRMEKMSVRVPTRAEVKAAPRP